MTRQAIRTTLISLAILSCLCMFAAGLLAEWWQARHRALQTAEATDAAAAMEHRAAREEMAHQEMERGHTASAVEEAASSTAENRGGDFGPASVRRAPSKSAIKTDEDGVAGTPSSTSEPRGFGDRADDATAARTSDSWSQQERQRPTPPKLTAGCVNDHAQMDEFERFMKLASTTGSRNLPQVAIGQRITIDVAARNGEPIRDAQVVIRQRRRDEPLSISRTGGDGRTFVLTDWDGLDRQKDVRLEVTAPGEDAIADVSTRQIRQDREQIWNVRLNRRRQAPKRLDLSLLIDTTGSMDDELDYLKREVDSIAESVHEMFPEVQQRYSLIVYRDQGDEYICRTFDFTESLEEFRSHLVAQTADGGGNYPEAMHVALQQAGQLNWNEQPATRMAFLIGDAPPHDKHAAKSLLAFEQLRQRGVRVYPIAASGTGRKAEMVMRSAAFLTLGEYLFLTDHSGIGNPHAAPHVDEYQVEYLRELMIRKVASELAGKRFTPQEILAIERGSLPALATSQRSFPATNQLASYIGNTVDCCVSHCEISPSLLDPWLKYAPRWLLITAVVLCVCLVDALMHREASAP